MAWELLGTEAAVSLGPQRSAYGLAQRTWLLTEESGPKGLKVRKRPGRGGGQGWGSG